MGSRGISFGLKKASPCDEAHSAERGGLASLVSTSLRHEPEGSHPSCLLQKNS